MRITPAACALARNSGVARHSALASNNARMDAAIKLRVGNSKAMKKIACCIVTGVRKVNGVA